MYLFSIYTINTLKTQGIVREDFDAFHVDLSLFESFDYDAYLNEYKSHFKKPRATKVLKHSSEVLRDSSDDVVVALANEFYENSMNTPICFDMNQVLNDVAPGVNGSAESLHNNNNNNNSDLLGVGTSYDAGIAVEKPKRKYNRKPKVDAGTVVSDEAVAISNVDAMVNMLSTSLDQLSIQLQDVSSDIGVAGAGAGAGAGASEKPKRKYNRKPKAVGEVNNPHADTKVVPKESSASASDSGFTENNSIDASLDALNASLQTMNIIGDGCIDVNALAMVSEKPKPKPKRKNAKKTKNNENGGEGVEGGIVVDACVDDVEVEKPKPKPERKNTKKTKNNDDEVDKVVNEISSEKPKRKYTKKTAVQYIDESVSEITAKIVNAAIQGVATEIASPGNYSEEGGYATENEEEPIQIVRSGTPILHNSCEEEPYEKDCEVEGGGDDEEDRATLCDDDDDDDEYENIVTKKVNIRGKDYLIGNNNKVYDYASQKTVGKYRSDDVVLF